MAIVFHPKEQDMLHSSYLLRRPLIFTISALFVLLLTPGVTRPLSAAENVVPVAPAPTPSTIEQSQPTTIFMDDATTDLTNRKYVETDGTIQLAPMKSTDFTQGTWSFQAYGSMTTSNDSDSLYLGHMGVGYFMWDGFSVNLEVVGGVVDGSNENQATGGDFEASGFDVLLRWHLLRGDGWSIYAEGGAGTLYTSKSFPADGTHFNFTPQVGAGVTLRVLGDMRLMGGIRWHHISNAGIYDHGINPGFDGIMTYAGLMIPF